MTVRTERTARHVMVVAIDRQERRNAFDVATAERLEEAFSSLEEDVRALVLHGAGEHFCSGADLKERMGLDDEEWQRQHRVFEAAFERLRGIEVPTIAAVEGAALGGGFELALSCDFILCGRSARFAFPEVARGIIPGCGGMTLLSRRAGLGRSKDAVLTGRVLSAAEALAWGVANEVVDDGQALPRAVELASAVAANAPIAVREAKQAIEDGLALPLREAIELELRAYGRVVTTEDRREGVRAFGERRRARFEGR